MILISNAANSCSLVTAQKQPKNAEAESASGTVTLTRVDANGYAGTFDVTFGNGHVTGSFTTTVCAALTTSIGGTCT